MGGAAGAEECFAAVCRPPRAPRVNGLSTLPRACLKTNRPQRGDRAMSVHARERVVAGQPLHLRSGALIPLPFLPDFKPFLPALLPLLSLFLPVFLPLPLFLVFAVSPLLFLVPNRIAFGDHVTDTNPRLGV